MNTQTSQEGLYQPANSNNFNPPYEESASNPVFKVNTSQHPGGYARVWTWEFPLILKRLRHLLYLFTFNSISIPYIEIGTGSVNFFRDHPMSYQVVPIGCFTSFVFGVTLVSIHGMHISWSIL